MPWDHAHYETAYAVFLTSGCDESSTPAAIFQSKEDAEEYIAHERKKAAEEDDGLHAHHCYPEAGVHEVRNAFIPWWNDYRDVPEETPPALPDYEQNDLIADAGKYEHVEMVDLLREVAGFVGPKVTRRLSESQRKLLTDIAGSTTPSLEFDDNN